MDYSKICFVIMPFGRKKVDDIEVDFDGIYQKIFEPAIRNVQLPEGGYLIPRRTDKDYFSGHIELEMFRYLEYSRFALVDITGLNANVFYELGVRHRARQSGTAIFRQSDKVIPFDISHIKAFPYEYEPEDHIPESIELVRKVLSGSITQNNDDNLVKLAIQNQQNYGEPLEKVLQDATNALRVDDFIQAISSYKKAVQIDSQNHLLHLKLGLLQKHAELWTEAMQSFQKSISLNSRSNEAWRELGIVQNKLFHQQLKAKIKAGRNQNEARGDLKVEGYSAGIDSIQKAIELDSSDFDALASLGGILKREGDLIGAYEMYKRSVEVSNGHSYPLVNFLILQIKLHGINSLTPTHKRYMMRVIIPLSKQTQEPPYEAPWSFFDLSTIKLMLGEPQEALAILKKGIVHAQDWAINTHLETLSLMRESPIEGLPIILNELEAALKPF
jgi:tetratricopeptide (TPR) repeat protein